MSVYDRPYVNMPQFEWKLDREMSKKRRKPFYRPQRDLTTIDEFEAKLDPMGKALKELKRQNLYTEALLKHQLGISPYEQLSYYNYDQLQNKLMKLEKVAETELQVNKKISDPTKEEIEKIEKQLSYNVTPQALEKVLKKAHAEARRDADKVLIAQELKRITGKEKYGELSKREEEDVSKALIGSSAELERDLGEALGESIAPPVRKSQRKPPARKK